MVKQLSAFGAGLTFGLGLVISQMVNPAKVLAFLDVFGNWDPSLAFVMGGALAVTAVGYRLVLRQSRPVLADGFQIPSKRSVDRQLVLGALLFGVGWGLVGLCPGPAIAAIFLGGAEAITFLAAMTVGVVAYGLSPLDARSQAA